MEVEVGFEVFFGVGIGIEVRKRFQNWNRSVGEVETGIENGIEVKKRFQNWNRSFHEVETGIEIGIEVKKQYQNWNRSFCEVETGIGLESKFQSGINCNTFKTATIFEAKLTVNEGFWEGNFAPKSDNVQKVFSCLFL